MDEFRLSQSGQPSLYACVSGGSLDLCVRLVQPLSWLMSLVAFLIPTCSLCTAATMSLLLQCDYHQPKLTAAHHNCVKTITT